MTPAEYAKKYGLAKSYIGNIKHKMRAEDRLLVFGEKGDRFNEDILHQLWPSRRLPTHLFKALTPWRSG